MIDTMNQKCSGCSACQSICPFQAIEMKKTDRGFLYPSVTSSLCRSCGLCDKVCPAGKEHQASDAAYFAVQHKDAEARRHSQSGGLFTALAQTVLSDGGVCYGAGMDESMRVCQCRIESVSELSRLQGSKYSQCDQQDCFSAVSDDLEKGRTVLFSATSCVIAGLLNYLDLKKINTQQLITCDLICRGVPTPKMWKDNIALQTRKHGELVQAHFRDKRFGWHFYMESYEFTDGTMTAEKYYMDLYFTHAAHRECCFGCEYAVWERKVADVTMGDFLGCAYVDTGIQDDNTGISVAVVHTQKGMELLKRSEVIYVELSEADAKRKNHIGGIKKPVWREKFWRDYHEKGYEYVLRKYTTYGGIPFKIKRKLKRAFGRW